jgi:hypothetical protein
MGYQNGFTYVSGPMPKVVLSTISSVCTSKGRNPVTLDARGYVIEATSDTTAIYGIIQHNAVDSLYPGKCSVEMPDQRTVYAVKVQTGVAASLFTIGRSYNIEKSGDHMRLDTDSQTTPLITLSPRDNGAVIDSTDSSVFVTFLGNALGVWGSNASVNVFNQN